MENRVIKFRAWDLRENKWRYHYEEIGGFDIKGELILLGEFGSDLPLERFLNDVVIQQFTGLKDKNGDEVYEGDICWTYEPGIGNLNRTVSFDGGGFVLNHEHMPPSDLRGWKQDYIKVLGNIYQHPHLIKQPS